MDFSLLVISAVSIFGVYKRFGKITEQMKGIEKKKGIMGLYYIVEGLAALCMALFNVDMVILLETVAMVAGVTGINRMIFVLVVLMCEVLISVIRKRKVKK